MSNPNMVADDNKGKGVPPYDRSNPENWKQNFVMFLRQKNRNHLGLGLPPAAPVNQYAATLSRYEKDVENYYERRDTCVSFVWEAVKNDSQVLEVIALYVSMRESLPVNDPNRGDLEPEVMLERAVDKFRGKVQNVLEELNMKYTNFVIKGKEVTPGIDQLRTIIQDLTKHGQPPSVASQLAKLKSSIKTPEFTQLYLSVSLMPNLTFDLISEAGKEFDKANKEIIAMTSMSDPELHLLGDREDNGKVCSYPKCNNKIGHTLEKCWKRQQDLKKRKGEQESSTGGERQVPGSDSYSGCDKCGADDHRARDCNKKLRKSSDDDGGDTREIIRKLKEKLKKLTSSKEEKGGKKSGIEKYVKKDEESDGDSYDSADSG